MQITVVLERHGASPTGFAVPEDVVLAFGTGKRVPVVVTINGYSYRSTVGPWHGRYMVPLAAKHREAVGVGPGQEVTVDLALDTEPREQ